MSNSTKQIFISQQCIITMQVTVSVGSTNNSALFQYIHEECTHKLGMPHLIRFSPPKCMHVCQPPRFTFSTTSQSFMRNVCLFRQCHHHLPQETTQVRTSFNSAPACWMRHLFYFSVSERFYITNNSYCSLSISICHFPMDWVESVRWSATHFFPTHEPGTQH